MHKGAPPEQVFGGDSEKGTWVSSESVPSVSAAPLFEAAKTLSASRRSPRFFSAEDSRTCSSLGCASSHDCHSLATPQRPPVQSPLDPARPVLSIPTC